MLLQPQKLFVNGKWIDSYSARSFTTVNPATEEAIAEIAEANEKDVDAAVVSARAALTGPWAKMSPSERGRLIWKIADLLEKNIDEFAKLETLDTGKTINESRYADMPLCIDILRFYAGATTKIHGETLPVPPNFFTFTLKEPVGIVAAITPWNFPLLLSLWKIGPALATGSTIIHKPSSMTPLTALRFAQICQEAGLPDGVLNVVTGPGNKVGSALVTHPGIDKVSFTGETSTGKEIMRLASDSLKRIALELGGKSPNIVFEDADLDFAIKGLFNGIFYNKGEVCCAGSRAFVHKKIHSACMEKLVERVKKTTLGDPLDKNTRMGPLVSKGQVDKVASFVESGKKEGATLLYGGSKPLNLPKGYFYTPTLFENVNNNMKIAREEIFGPVLSVIPFEDFNEVIEKSNDTFYGLAAGIWTKDIKKAHKAARALKAGTVWINTYDIFDAAAPFGGYKASGFGREMGMAGLEPFTETKTVWVDLS